KLHGPERGLPMSSDLPMGGRARMNPSQRGSDEQMVGAAQQVLHRALSIALGTSSPRQRRSRWLRLVEVPVGESHEIVCVDEALRESPRLNRRLGRPDRYPRRPQAIGSNEQIFGTE